MDNQHQLRKDSMVFLYLLFGIFSLVIGVAGGMAIASGAMVIVIPIFSLALCLILLIVPIEWLFVATVVFSFFIVGLVGYMAKISQIYWIPYILGLVFWLISLVRLALMRRRNAGALPFVLWVFVCYLLMIGMNAIVNPQPAVVYMVAAKNYIFLIGIFIAGYVLIQQPRTYELIWKILLFIALLQLPIAIFQYVVVGGRLAEEGKHGWDAVSGSFGGSESGGASGSMGIFLVTMLVLLVNLIRNGQIAKRRAFFLMAVCLAPVFVGEVKAIFLVFLPMAFFWLFRAKIFQHPLQTGAWSLVLGAVMATGLLAYEVLHYQDAQGVSSRSVTEQFTEAVLLDTDPNHVRVLTGEMGRTALLVLWWRHHGLDEPDKLLFGHGLGSIRVSSFYVGEVQKMFPRQLLNKHALSVLLWDTGLIGTFFYVLLLTASSRLSLRLAKLSAVPPLHRAYLETAGIFLALALVSLVYSRSVVDHPAMIVLVMLSLGQAVFWYYRLQTKSEGL